MNKKHHKGNHRNNTPKNNKPNNRQSDKSENKSNDKQGEMDGVISITAKGIGFVRSIKKGSFFRKEESVEVDHDHLNTALQGDRVRVSYKKGRDEKLVGEVLSIIIRSKSGFAGILEKKDGVFWLLPSDTKMYTDILIPQERLGGAKVGEKVFAIITSWKNQKDSPEGKIVEVLGQPGDNDVEMKAIALERGFSSNFPTEVIHEVEKFKDFKITPDEIKNRRDIRTTTTFTIDPEDAKDFDDAISFKDLGNNIFEVGIHIADVSHFVRPGTKLDREAYKRGTSVYLVDRTIPMLPEILSNDLCSLRPDEDRLAMSSIFEITADGTAHKAWYGKTVIRSQKRFTYENAQEVINTGIGTFANELIFLNNLAKTLREIRFENGAISLDQEEVKFVLDENGFPIKVIKKIRQDTNKMIEELMLLANRKVAEQMSGEDSSAFVYRIHDAPPTDNLVDLAFFLKQIGFNLPIRNGKVLPKDINTIIAELEGRTEKGAVHTSIIRSMAKAIYSTKNIGHFGLGFKYYTHFTSPIRRYPDVIVHRLLQDKVTHGHLAKKDLKEYETASIYASEREKNASNAERSSVKYKQVEYMSVRIGQTFDGVIAGATEWGIFVEEKESKCEGLIRLKDLRNDFYVYNEKEASVIGKKTKKRYRLGDKVRIKVIATDVTKLNIDYVLA